MVEFQLKQQISNIIMKNQEFTSMLINVYICEDLVVEESNISDLFNNQTY